MAGGDVLIVPHPRIEGYDELTLLREPAETMGFYMPAEWEPQACVWVVEPHNVETWPGEAALAVAQRQHAAWVAAMRDHGTTVRFIEELSIETNDSWVRDFGPVFVCRRDEGTKGRRDEDKASDSETSSLALHDFRFNAWGERWEPRPADDLVPQHLARHLGLPLWVHDFVLEGGSIDVNGAGDVMTTESCLLHPKRNPHLDRGGIEAVLRHTLGIERVVWLPGGIAGDDTSGHVDDVARFLSIDLVALVTPPKHHEDYAAMSANRRVLEATGYTILDLPSPEPITFDYPEEGVQPVPASYANFLLSNGHLYMPAFGQPSDDLAAKRLEDATDYKIVPVRAEHLVVGLGALHCLSMQQPAI